MKLSMEGYVPCTRLGDEAGLKLIKGAGFDCVDYSFYWQNDSTEIVGENYLEHAKSVREILDEIGLECNQAHAPFNMKYGDAADESDENFKRIVRSMEAASVMGAGHIVVHSINVPFGEDIIEYNTKYYKSLEPYCEKFKIKIAIENLFYTDPKSECCRGRIHTPELLYEILEKLDSEWFILCIDVGHCAVVGIEPDEMISALDNKVLGALHIHDNEYKIDKHMIPYHGSLDWDKITSALKNIGYKGELTLEIFNELRKYDVGLLPEAVAFAAKVGKFLINKITGETK